MGNYTSVYRHSVEEPEAFWAEQAALVDWAVAPREILDRAGAPLFRWFPGATLNTCHNAVDRHVEAGHGDRTALVYDSPVTRTVTRISYAELRADVAAFAGALRDHGVVKGDRVVIYLPMIAEAVVAMLACARIGAVHSVVFGGFAPQELANRIDDCQPKVLVTASCGIERDRVVEYLPIVRRALDLAEHAVDVRIVKQRPQHPVPLTSAGERDWDQTLEAAQPAACVEVAATDPLYILYTSGTTDRPKGIVRDNGGHAVAMAWSLPNIFGIRAGQTWWAASDIGWVVGHSYIVYAPLITGATTVIYEGKPVGTPDAGAFWRVIGDHRVEAMFTAPTAIRAIKKEDPDARLLDRDAISSLRALFLAGERLDPQTYEWAAQALGVPVIDNYWQTETGWPIAANPIGLQALRVKPGSATVAMPGYVVRVLDAQGAAVPAGEDGAICLKLPLPPGALPTLWGDDQRYVEAYLSGFEGHYVSGDGGHVDEDGYLFVMGRTDDVINVAGHRLSTGSMEAVLARHPAVAECAVIGVADALKGQVPRGFVVLKAGVADSPADIQRQLIDLVRQDIGPVASFKDVTVVAALPKTRSGKILRRTMREIADGHDPDVPATIEDPAILDALRAVLVRSGAGQ